MKKKNLLLTVVACIGFAMTNFAQIPNPGFEDWNSPAANPPSGWVITTGLYGNVTHFTPGHNNSNYAVSLNLGNLSQANGGLSRIFYGSNGYAGFVIDYSRPQFLFGYVKGSSLGVTIKVFAQGANTVSGEGLIGIGSGVVHGGEWTQFSIPINYTTSSLGRIVTIELQNVGGSGNSVLVDDLELSFSAADLIEKTEGHLISIFPNPIQSMINVKANINLLGEIYTISDNAGRVVLTGILNNENTSIEIGNLPGGTYFLSVAETQKQFIKIVND